MKRILALIICFLIVASLIGCKEADTGINAETLEQALLNALCIDSGLFETADAEFVTYIEDSTTIKVNSFEQNGDMITAKVEVVAPDLYTAVLNLEDVLVEDNVDEINNLLIEGMNDTDSLKSVVDVDFEISDDKIKAILTDEFLDAYYGGVFKLRDQYLDNIIIDTDSFTDEGDFYEEETFTEGDEEYSTEILDQLLVINSSECSGFIDNCTAEIYDGGCSIGIGDETDFYMNGLVVSCFFGIADGYLESEEEDYSYGLMIVDENGNIYENDEISYWADVWLGELVVDIPDDIEGTYEIQFYQCVGSDEGEISINFSVF